MKTILYILLFLLMLPFTGLAQNDSIVKKQDSFNNQIDLDVEAVGVEFLYKHRIGNKLFLGVGFGLGALVSIAESGTFADFLRGNLLFDYQISKKFHINQVSTFSIFTYNSSDNSYIQSLRLGVGIFYKILRVEFGIEPSIILSSKKSGELASTLLILKIPLKRW